MAEIELQLAPEDAAFAAAAAEPRAASRQVKAVNWGITWFIKDEVPWSLERDQALRERIVDCNTGEDAHAEKVLYLATKCETCPTTGNLHYHFFIRLNRKRNYTYIINNFEAMFPWAVDFKRPSLLRPRKPLSNWRTYCLKDESRTPGYPNIELGLWEGEGGQGRDKDRDVVATAMMEGMSSREVVRRFPGFALNNLDKVLAFEDAIRPEPPVFMERAVYLLYGPSGTGKSHFVWAPEAAGGHPDGARGDSTRVHTWPLGGSKGSLFAGNYTGQPVSFRDEYTGQWPRTFLNQLLDKYPVDVEVKRGQRRWATATIFIGTNTHPSTWYEWAESPHYYERLELWRSLVRRFTRVYIFEAGHRGPRRVLERGGEGWDAWWGRPATLGADAPVRLGDGGGRLAHVERPDLIDLTQ